MQSQNYGIQNYGLEEEHQSLKGTGIGLLERPETQQKKPGDRDRFAHYVAANRLAAARMTGQPVVALCGKVWVPTGEAHNHPICPRCEEIKDEMDKNGGVDWPFRGPGRG